MLLKREKKKRGGCKIHVFVHANYIRERFFVVLIMILNQPHSPLNKNLNWKLTKQHQRICMVHRLKLLSNYARKYNTKCCHLNAQFLLSYRYVHTLRSLPAFFKKIMYAIKIFRNKVVTAQSFDFPSHQFQGSVFHFLLINFQLLRLTTSYVNIKIKWFRYLYYIMIKLLTNKTYLSINRRCACDIKFSKKKKWNYKRKVGRKKPSRTNKNWTSLIYNTNIQIFTSLP